MRLNFEAYAGRAARAAASACRANASGEAVVGRADGQRFGCSYRECSGRVALCDGCAFRLTKAVIYGTTSGFGPAFSFKAWVNSCRPDTICGAFVSTVLASFSE